MRIFTKATLEEISMFKVTAKDQALALQKLGCTLKGIFKARFLYANMPVLDRVSKFYKLVNQPVKDPEKKLEQYETNLRGCKCVYFKHSAEDFGFQVCKHQYHYWLLQKLNPSNELQFLIDRGLDALAVDDHQTAGRTAYFIATFYHLRDLSQGITPDSYIAEQIKMGNDTETLELIDNA